MATVICNRGRAYKTGQDKDRQDDSYFKQYNGYFPILSAVQTNGADAFKLLLYRISRALQGVDARIVKLLHDEVIIGARDEKALQNDVCPIKPGGFRAKE